jgi:DNA-binding MarR family transcriptional regulator/GNAT superfamily N-acetyltransferase
MARMAPPCSDLERRIAAVRRFTRFYTRQIGLLQEGDLLGPFSLAQARVLDELANRDRPTASELAADLGLDHGYLSRILRRFVEQRLLTRKPAPEDGRQSLLMLTAKGRKAFAPLNMRSHDEVGAMLGKLDDADQRRVVAAMATVEELLAGTPAAKPAFILRPHRVGDMGWVVSAHGALYAREYGWDISFEALVAEIAAEFIRKFDAKRECCWIAEMDGEPTGSAFVVRKSDAVAKLRLVIVDPKARGMGLGRRLVRESMRFARDAGYTSMTLWTQSILSAARAIYETEGFTCVGQEPHHSFGVDLIGETWERAL